MNNLIISLSIWFLAILAIRAESTVRKYQDGSPVPVHLIEEISITVAGKWYMCIREKGSSYLNYGVSPMDVARIPEGKVSLAETYSKVKDRLVLQPEELETNDIVIVNLMVKNGSRIGDNVVRYMEASEAYVIFDNLVVNGEPYEKQSFEILLNQYPPDPARKAHYHYDENGTLQVAPYPSADAKHPSKTEQQDIERDENRIRSKDKAPSRQIEGEYENQKATESSVPAFLRSWVGFGGLALIIIVGVSAALIKRGVKARKL